MTMFRGAFSKALAPGYRKIVFETYKEKPIEGTALVNMNTSSRAYEEDFPIGGFGTLQIKPEGAGISYQDAIQGAAKRYLWTTYALGFRITQEMMEDDLYGVMGNRMSKALGRSARNNAEVVMHSVFNNAFSTSFVGFEAGVALCSASHTLLRGGTVSNTAAADFALATYQASLENFHNLVDESGMPMMITPKTLVHTVTDQWIVAQTLKSQFLPASPNNDINPVLSYGVTPHLSHYLTDADSWFLLGDSHDVNYFDRRPATFSNSDDFETGDAKYKVTRRNGAGFGDWRGVYGSPGA